jgi:copper chaperone CopZ
MKLPVLAKINIPINRSDVVVLIILGILFVFGIRIVIGFFKTSKKNRQLIRDMQENTEQVRTPKSVKERNAELSKAAAEHADIDFEKQQNVTIEVDVEIEGMMCGMCESHVKDAIRKAFPDAKHVSASHVKGRATFQLKNRLEQQVVEKKLHAAIDSIGYGIISVKERLMA